MSQQIIAKNRREALKFCEGGRRDSQRTAYWLKNGIAYRFERLPGDTIPTWQDHVEGNWWSATKTVRRKLNERPIKKHRRQANESKIM